MKTYWKQALFCFFMLCVFSSNAQYWLWARDATNGVGSRTAKCVTTDAAGNVYVAGAYSGGLTLGSFFLVGIAAEDFFIAKYDPNGTVLWAKRAGSGGYNGGLGIKTDASGNVVVTGHYQGSSITFDTYVLTNTNQNTPDLFVVKYDPNGNVLWARSAGSTNGDESRSVAIDNSGNIYITGVFGGTIAFGTFTLTNVGFFVVKYNTQGVVMWALQTGTGGGNAYGITVDQSDRIYVTGYFFAGPPVVIGSTSLTSNGSTDTFLAKYDTLGNVLWARSEGGASIDLSRSVAADNAGRVYTCGHFQSVTLNFGSDVLVNTSTSGTLYDVYLFQYDSAGNRQWARSAGSTENDNAFAVTITPNGNVYLCGDFYGLSMDFGNNSVTNSTTSAISDIFLTGYDPSGNNIYAFSAGNFSTDWSFGLCSDNVGNLHYVGGYGSNWIYFGTHQLISSIYPNGIDIFVAKLNPNTLVGSYTVEVSDLFQVFPTPSSGRLYIKCEVDVEKVQVFSANGKLVMDFNISGERVIDLSSKEDGLYFLLFFREDNIIIRKALIQR